VTVCILGEVLFGLFDPEDEGTMVLRNIGNYSPKTLELSCTILFKTASQFCIK